MPSSRQVRPAQTWHGLSLVLVAALLVSLGAPLRDVCAWFGTCPCHVATTAGMAPHSEAPTCLCCGVERADAGEADCDGCGEHEAPQAPCCCMVVPTSPQEVATFAVATPTPFDLLVGFAASQPPSYNLAPLAQDLRGKPRRAPPLTPQAAGWLPPLRP